MSQPAQVWTVQRLLEWTVPFFTRKNIDTPRLSAELLLAHVLSQPRIKLYTDFQRILTDADLAAYRALVQRAADHEPIAYLTGGAHFFNLEFEVTRDVLIPRPDTETLVENVIQLARHTPGLESPRILDLCTGSGCVAAALAQNLKSADVVATDSSPAAVAVARRNLQRLNLAPRIVLAEGDLFAPLAGLPDQRPFDVVVANPPYIPTAQIEALPQSVRAFEPRAALDGGPDGLAVHRRILAEVGRWLAPGGRIFLEIAFDQAPPALRLAAEYPQFLDVRILKDHAANDRVLSVRTK